MAGGYHELYDQAGLVVRVDLNCWIKTGIEVRAWRAICQRGGDQRLLRLGGGTAAAEPAGNLAALVRKGRNCGIFYSLDAAYTLLRIAYLLPSAARPWPASCASARWQQRSVYPASTFAPRCWEGGMMARKPASAACAFCGREVAGTGMTKHLATCAERQAAIDKAEARAKRKAQPLLSHRRADTIDGLYWLHLEVAGSSTLRGCRQLSARRIWNRLFAAAQATSSSARRVTRG